MTSKDLRSEINRVIQGIPEKFLEDIFQVQWLKNSKKSLKFFIKIVSLW
jgi:hypothetical protein